MHRLNTEDRAFFSKVARATLTNPFTDERESLDLELAGRAKGPWEPGCVEEAALAIQNRIHQLKADKKADIRLFREPDRRLVECTFLFNTFHRFVAQCDALIADQIAAQDRSLPVPFAGRMIDTLKQYGFSHQDAVRYFELCYQVRRAFYFIQRNLVGRSACMRDLRASLWNNVFTHNIDWYDRFLWNRMEDFSTLILGPTGAGKGTAAVAIGRSGYIPFDERRNSFVISFMQSFLSLNLSQFSPTLIESELFGHKKGAFTGAVEEYKGVFDRCSPYGAIFLDEIGEVSENVQIKLLQVLQERAYAPVGGHKPSRFEGRVIAATNRPLETIRKQHILRDDFFYRLCSDVILLPSLAQRIAQDPLELDDLLAHTVTRILGKPSPEMTHMLRKAIERQPGPGYPWPGNVRELEQCVRRIMLNHAYDPHSPATRCDLESRLCESLTRGDLDVQALVTGYCLLLHKRLGTYGAVADRTGLDRRTVKKYIQEGRQQFEKEPTPLPFPEPIKRA